MSKKKSEAAPESVVAVEAKPKRARARKQSTDAPAADEPATETAPWNPTVTMTWEGESEPCWTGAFDALAEMNALDAARDQEFLDEMRAALREQGDFKGGGGAAPVYVLAVAEPVQAKPKRTKRAHAAQEPISEQMGTEPTTGHEQPKRSRARKSSAMTLAELSEKYIASLEADGKSDATVGAYKSDMAIAQRVLGEDVTVDAITPADVARFNQSDAVLLSRAGQPKAEPTYQRTRRVLRLALDYAEAEGWITVSPCAC